MGCYAYNQMTQVDFALVNLLLQSKISLFCQAMSKLILPRRSDILF